MSARTVSTELVAALKRLRLGGLLPTLAERFTLAEKEDTPYEDLLLLLLVDEISRRDSNASTRRAEQAGLDPDMVLERWDKSAKVTYDRRVMNELASEYMRMRLARVGCDRELHQPARAGTPGRSVRRAA